MSNQEIIEQERLKAFFVLIDIYEKEKPQLMVPQFIFFTAKETISLLKKENEFLKNRLSDFEKKASQHE